jgi:16S rRNA (adenine1518-N6/adenine1519-N6)-dimethyltransferase
MVRLIPLRPLPHPAHDETLFGNIVAAAFSQRRKTLRNSLSHYLEAADCTALGIDPQSRAQNLSVAQFVAVANFLGARRS